MVVNMDLGVPGSRRVPDIATWIHVSEARLRGLLAARGRGGAGRGAREAAGPHVPEAQLRGLLAARA